MVDTVVDDIWSVPTYEDGLAVYDRRLAQLQEERAARRAIAEGRQAHLGFIDKFFAPSIESEEDKLDYQVARNKILYERDGYMRTRQNELAQQVADEYNKLYGGRATADEVSRGVNGFIMGRRVSQGNIDALERRLNELRGTQSAQPAQTAQATQPAQTAQATQPAQTAQATQPVPTAQFVPQSESMKRLMTVTSPQMIRSQIAGKEPIPTTDKTTDGNKSVVSSGSKTTSTTGTAKAATNAKTTGGSNTASGATTSSTQQVSYQPLQPNVVNSAFQPKSFDGVLDYRGGILPGANRYFNPMLVNAINRSMSEYAGNEANARNAVAKVGQIRAQHDPVTYQQMQNYMTQGGMSAPEAFMAAMTDHTLANGNYGAAAQTLTNTQNAMDKAALRGATTAAMTGTPYQPFTNQYGMRSMNLVSGYRPNGDGTVSIFTPNGVVNGVSMDAAQRMLALNGNGDMAQQGMRHMLFNQPQVDTSMAELAGLGEAKSNVDRMREEMRAITNTQSEATVKPVSEKDAIAGVYKSVQNYRDNNKAAHTASKEAEKAGGPKPRSEIF